MARATFFDQDCLASGARKRRATRWSRRKWPSLLLSAYTLGFRLMHTAAFLYSRFFAAIDLQARRKPPLQAPTDVISAAAGASAGGNPTAASTRGPGASIGIAKGSTVAKITAVAAMGKRYRANKTEDGSPASGECALVNITTSRGTGGNGAGAAAGTSGGGGGWSSLLGKGSASGQTCAEVGGNSSGNTPTASGGAATVRPGEGSFADIVPGGVGVAGADPAAETGGKTIEPGVTGGDIGFEAEEDDEDCSWFIPEAAAPKAVWQGHIGPVTRIGSCGQPPCFFSLGEVCAMLLTACL